MFNNDFILIIGREEKCQYQYTLLMLSHVGPCFGANILYYKSNKTAFNGITFGVYFHKRALCKNLLKRRAHMIGQTLKKWRIAERCFKE